MCLIDITLECDPLGMNAALNRIFVYFYLHNILCIWLKMYKVKCS